MPPADAFIKAFEQAQRMKHAPTSYTSGTSSSTVAPVTTPVLGVWTALGPAPIQTPICCTRSTELDSGRITAMAVNPSDSNEVWVGAADGGLWHSGNGGAAWAPVTDGEDTLAVGAVAIDPVNPRTIYIGTGEGNSDGDNYWGIGILKSTDNGQTWTNYGYNQFAGLSIARLAIDPADTQVILAAVTPMYRSSTGGFLPPPDSQYPGGAPSLANMGIWRSVDSGQTWNQVIATDSPSPSAAGTDIAFDPADPNIVFAAMGGVSARSSLAGIWKSSNSGQTFTQIVSSGLPDPMSIKRIAFGISTDGTHLYAAMSDMNRNLLNSSIYYSPDGGTTWDWHTVADSAMVTYHNEHQWDYGSAVAVDPSDVTGNTVYVAGVDIYFSTDGGITWQNLTDVYGSNPFGVHPDQHAIAFFSATSSSFYFGNDGGVWSSTGITSYPVINDLNAGLNITQFYGGGIGTAGGNAQLYGGTQDNGTDQYPTGAPTGLAQWNEAQGGDGGNTVVDYTNNAIVYGEVAGDPTIITKSTDGGATWAQVTNGIDLTQSTVTQNFVPPLVMSPGNHNELFTGTDYLYKSTDGAATWTKTSSNTVDDNKLSAIAVFPGSDSDIYVGDNGGVVSVSTDGGVTFKPRPFNIPTTGGMVTGVAVDPLDPNTIYATVADFATCSSCGEHVFRATNVTDPNTFKWTDISTSLPNAPFESILVSTFDNNTIFAGSDVGVFESTDAGANWMHLFGLPKVAIDQMFTDPGGGTLYVATHGRGMWKVPLTTGHVYDTGGSCVNSAGGYVSCMYSLNASDASTVWQVPWSGVFNGPLPVYANGVIYGFWGNGNGDWVQALDASTGAQLWQSQLLAFTGSGGLTGTTVANGAVYVGCSQTAYAFDASSGALLWSHQIGVNLGQGIRPAADANGVYYGADDGKEYAFSVSTGVQLWSKSINSSKGPAPSPSAAANGLIYVSSNDTSDKNVLYALNASTGRVSYSMSLGGDNVDPTPLVGNGLLYIKTLRGWLYAIKPDLSAIVWSVQDYGRPALDGNKIFILADANIYGANLYALDASTGNVLWGPVGNGVLSGDPAAAGGVVSTASDTSCPVLPAFAEGTGHLLWQWIPPGSACASQSDPLVAAS